MKYMIKFLLSISIVVGLFSEVFAQSKPYEWSEGKDGKYSYRYVTNDPRGSRYYKLSNGLTVVLSPNKKEPRIQSYIVTRAGAKNDPANQTGLAHYLEHLMFKGTDKIGTKNFAGESVLLDQIDKLYERYNKLTDDEQRKDLYKEIDRVSGQAAKFAIPNEYDKLMSSIGATEVNAYTGFDMTAYHEDIPKNMIDKYLAIQTERFRNPIFRLFHTELETVYEEKNMSLDNDQSRAITAVFESLFSNHNYGKQTILGSPDHLKNPSLKAIRDFYDAYYVPNNMAIVLSGDFDPSEMIVKIDQAFGNMKPKAVPIYSFDKEVSINRPIIKEVKGPDAESLYLGIRFPGAVEKNAVLLKLLCKILQNGSAGLFDLNLNKSQRVQEAWAYPYILKDYSLLLIGATPVPGQTLDEVRALLLTELEKLRAGNLSEDLLEAVVNNEIRVRMESMDSRKFLASELVDAFTMEIDWADKVKFENELSKVTVADIIQFVNRYFTGQNYVAVNKLHGLGQKDEKIIKPAINPISINRNDQSAFLTNILAMPEHKIEPQWIDYSKDVAKLKFNDLDVVAVHNKDHALFVQVYKYPFGRWSNKLLPIAVSYLDFIGTSQKSAEEISKSFYRLASKFDIQVGDEETYVNISGLNDHYTKTVDLLHDLLKHCVADSRTFAQFIANLKKSRNDAKTDKNNIMAGLLSYAKYGAKNPFNTILTDEELDTLKAEDLVAVLHELAEMKYDILYYGPQQDKDLLRLLKPLKEPGKLFKVAPSVADFKIRPMTVNELYFAEFEMSQADIKWFRGGSQYNKDNDALISLYNNYFGQGMGAIVFQTIREAKALAYSTSAYFAKPTKQGKPYEMYAYVGTQADKFNDAIEAMNEIMNDLPQSPQGFENARTGLIKSIASKRIHGLEKLNSYLHALKYGLDGEDNRQIIYNKLATLTLDDLTKFHQREISNKPYAYCVVGQEDKLDLQQMSKLGSIKRLSLKEIFGY